jgi:hypothetical protein
MNAIATVAPAFAAEQDVDPLVPEARPRHRQLPYPLT